MALPPAVRLMAIGTMVVFCYLCAQIFRAPSSLSAVGKDAVKFSDMPTDPNLDRMYILPCFNIYTTSDMYS
jgi:mannosyltransferase